MSDADIDKLRPELWRQYGSAVAEGEELVGYAANEGQAANFVNAHSDSLAALQSRLDAARVEMRKLFNCVLTSNGAAHVDAALAALDLAPQKDRQPE